MLPYANKSKLLIYTVLFAFSYYDTCNFSVWISELEFTLWLITAVEGTFCFVNLNISDK